MIHRTDRVNPDVDDRLIRPNEARSAGNLRMAASIDDTNLGISTVNGMAQLAYAAPSGDNQVVGIREDYETDYCYYALWNSNDEHGMWRTNGQVAEKIIPIPGLVEDSDVSIAVIDGKIYFTDNINQPRMCNIAKGIAGDYPDPLEEWMITQIKRPSGLAPLAGQVSVSGSDALTRFTYTLEQISDDYDNSIKVPEGTQYAVYYVYDNDEESRLSPYSDIVFNVRAGGFQNFIIQLPIEEYETYLSGNTLVSEVVFCYRRGNDGLWNVFGRVENIDGNKVATDQSAFGGPASGFTLQVVIEDTNFLPIETVSANITSADFDAAPLLAVTNETAQNRLDLGNVLVDYPQWTGLTLELTAVNKVDTVLTGDAAQSGLTFRPAGRYQVGVEILDLWQRRIGVVAVQAVTFPDYISWANVILQADPPAGIFGDGNPNWYRDADNRYELDWTLTGTLPSWATYYRIVRTREQIATSRYRTVCRLYSWYVKNESEDVLVPYAEDSPTARLIVKGLTGGTTPFYFKGYVMELTMGEPIEYTTGSNLCVKIMGGVGNADILDENNFNVEFEIQKQVNNLYFFNFDENIGGTTDAIYVLKDLLLPVFYPNQSAFFDVEFYFKASAPDVNFYQTQYDSIRLAEDFVVSESGTLQGDCYLTKYKKINQAIKKISYGITPTSVDEINPQYGDPQQIWGAAISMNPIDIYNQVQVSSIGQAGVVNETQRQTRLYNVIVFTDPIILGSLNNGLNKFNSIDNRQAPLENGPITALVRTTAQQNQPGVLLAVGVVGVSSFYFGATQLTNADGTSNVTTTDAYLASQNPLLGLYGAAKGRNIIRTPKGNIYWWSEIVNDWIRYSQAGLDRIGQNNSFSNQLRQDLAGNPSVIGVYDQVTDECILVGRNEDAFVFSERYKTNQPKRAYYVGPGIITPERAAGLSRRTIFFLDGQIWVMGPGVNIDDNSFFGEDKSPYLTLVTNERPEDMKRWGGIKVYGPRPIVAELNSAESDVSPQQTSIPESWWQSRKGAWVTRIPGNQAMGAKFAGKPVECRILYSTFAFNPDMEKINYIEIISNLTAIQ